MSCEISRREFLIAAASAAGVTLVGLAGCGPKTQDDIPPPGAFSQQQGAMAVQNTDGSYLVRNGAKVAAGMGIAFNMPDNAPGIVFRDAAGKLHAISATCTHKGGQVRFEESNGAPQFRCPLHNSVFAADGHPVSGPAQLPLAAYSIAAHGDDAIIKTKA